MMSQIYSRHWKISSGHHFQNGQHNTANIQHCPISSKFDMWVNNDVLNYVGNHFRTSLSTHMWNGVEIGQCWIIAVLWRPFWKWRPVEIFQCRDINFYRLPFSKWPPLYRTNSTLSDFNDITYVGRLWCPEMILDIKKFLPVVIQ
jgi:hypothetical protein